MTKDLGNDLYSSTRALLRKAAAGLRMTALSLFRMTQIKKAPEMIGGFFKNCQLLKVN
jgi:hypothetical protein